MSTNPNKYAANQSRPVVPPTPNQAANKYADNRLPPNGNQPPPSNRPLAAPPNKYVEDNKPATNSSKYVEDNKPQDKYVDERQTYTNSVTYF